MNVTSRNIANGILRAIAVLVLCFVGLYFLYQVQTVLIYLVVALILTLIGNPILDFFKRRLKFKHIFATIATLMIFLIIIVGFFMLFIPMIVAQSHSLSLLDTVAIERNILTLVNKITLFLDGHNIDSAKVLKESNLTSKINFSFLPDFFNAIINTISSFGMGLASVLFITFFFLKDRLLFIIGAKKFDSRQP